MLWLRRSTLILSLALSFSVLLLVIHTFWMAVQPDPPVLDHRVRDLQVLVIILLALSTLYTVVFLLSPIVSDRILRRRTDDAIKAVQNQLQASVAELREVKEELRRIMLGNDRVVRQVRPETAPIPPKRTEEREGTAPGSNTDAPSAKVESGQISGNSREVDDELARIYRDLADHDSQQDDSSAISYLNRAIALTSDPAAAADLHYTLGCLLGRRGELEEALREIQMAFLNKRPELDQKLAVDTEEGGPLYELATRKPYDQVILDLLMDVSVGA
jgi:tetratricopeptide (TPR) repeat protein